MTAELQKELLNDAFKTFRKASKTLESQYSILERRIELLNSELTEKNRAMERNRRLAAMGEMAAKIAHEIRNPLGSVSIFSTLLERELSAEPAKRKLAEHISKGVKTLDNLLSNMLLFASSPRASRKTLDIKEVIEDSILLVRSSAKPGVSVKTDYRGCTLISGDGGLLRQLFANLLLNAHGALGSDGSITIKTDVPDAQPEESRVVEIEVTDTGCGIPAEHIDRIFDPFFSTRERGTGLGLAIVASVVTAHEGTIDATSTPGEGTAFLIRLPA
jgi:signal transduction histidine kinase